MHASSDRTLAPMPAAPAAISTTGNNWIDGEPPVGVKGAGFSTALVTVSAGSGAPNLPARYSRRHLNSRFVLTPCCSASFETDVPGTHAAVANSRLNSTARFGHPFRVGRCTLDGATVVPTTYLVGTTLPSHIIRWKTAYA